MPQRPFPSRLRPRERSLELIFMGASLLSACAGVLGIEDAACDPEFSFECPNAGAERGTGGSSTSMPEVGNASGSGGGGVAPSGPGGIGAAGSAAVAAIDVPPPESLCDEYCRVLAESCVAEDEQYASVAACLAVCAVLEPGERGAQQGNTVGCRLSRAELAASTGEPGNYCYSAGPGGAGVCGDDCEGFCAVMTAQCEQMGTVEQCLSACANVPDLSRPPTSITYDTTQQSGDSVQCRLFHVSAASLDPIGHCVHAAGFAVCSPPSAPSSSP